MPAPRRRPRPVLAAGLAAALVATAAVTAFAGPGAGAIDVADIAAADVQAAALGGGLDVTFGSAGLTDVPNTTRADAVAEAPDGFVVVAGRAGNAVAVTRFDAAGRLDPGFGGGGRATTTVNGAMTTTAVAVQPDGKIVVAGLEGATPILLRYQRNGQLDGGFGQGGIDRTVGIKPTAVAVQADGGILVAGGDLATGATSSPQVERHVPAGGLDTAFGAGGRGALPSTGLDVATDVLALADGRIVLGWSRGTGKDFAVGRLTAAGAPDGSFGSGGVATSTFPQGTATVQDLTLLADGSVVAAGSVVTPTPLTLLGLARYRTNGTPEPGFGNAGRVIITSPTSSTAMAVRVGTRPDGRIVIGTGSLQSPSGLVRAFQFLPNGVPDSNFGAGGVGTTTTSRNEFPLDIAGGVVRRDGRVVMAVSDGRAVADLSSPFLVGMTQAPRTDPDREGYWMLDGSGRVYAFGDAVYLGDPFPDIAASARFGVRAVDIAATATGEGYWVVDSIGRVFAFGDAVRFGDVTLPGNPTVSIARTSDGYVGFSGDLSSVRWTAAGSTPSSPGFAINEPVVDAAPAAPSGTYAVASDGGVFALGAPFLGSMGGTRLNQPVTGIAPDPDARGYWLVAADGGIFAFESVFKGSMGGIPLNQPVSDMVPWGDGYILVAADGGVFAFGNGPFAGSLGSIPPASPVVAVATLET